MITEIKSNSALNFMDIAFENEDLTYQSVDTKRSAAVALMMA